MFQALLIILRTIDITKNRDNMKHGVFDFLNGHKNSLSYSPRLNRKCTRPTKWIMDAYKQLFTYKKRLGDNFIKSGGQVFDTMKLENKDKFELSTRANLIGGFSDMFMLACLWGMNLRCQFTCSNLVDERLGRELDKYDGEYYIVTIPCLDSNMNPMHSSVLLSTLTELVNLTKSFRLLACEVDVVGSDADSIHAHHSISVYPCVGMPQMQISRNFFFISKNSKCSFTFWQDVSSINEFTFFPMKNDVLKYVAEKKLGSMGITSEDSVALEFDALDTIKIMDAFQSEKIPLDGYVYVEGFGTRAGIMVEPLDKPLKKNWSVNIDVSKTAESHLQMLDKTLDFLKPGNVFKENVLKHMKLEVKRMINSTLKHMKSNDLKYMLCDTNINSCEILDLNSDFFKTYTMFDGISALYGPKN